MAVDIATAIGEQNSVHSSHVLRPFASPPNMVRASVVLPVSVIANDLINCHKDWFGVNICFSDKNTTGVVTAKTVCHAPGSGYHYVEGETWDLDSCTKCTCHVGHVLCQVQKCPPTPCISPKRLVGQCCPVCEGSSLIGGKQ